MVRPRVIYGLKPAPLPVDLARDERLASESGRSCSIAWSCRRARDARGPSLADGLLNEEEFDLCCHGNLVRAVAPYRLGEADVLDVLNVFRVTGLTPGAGRAGAGPSRAGRRRHS